MDFDKGETREERINNIYCESELSKHEKLEDYETCAGILKAINFKKYGDSLGQSE